jgi:hypothetical protein
VVFGVGVVSYSAKVPPGLMSDRMDHHLSRRFGVNAAMESSPSCPAKVSLSLQDNPS